MSETTTVSGPSNYNTQFPQGPILDASGRLTVEWQRFFLRLFNRTGSGQGVDGAYVASQTSSNGNQITQMEAEIATLSGQLMLALLRAEVATNTAVHAMRDAEDAIVRNALTIAAIPAAIQQSTQGATLAALMMP